MKDIKEIRNFILLLLILVVLGAGVYTYTRYDGKADLLANQQGTTPTQKEEEPKKKEEAPKTTVTTKVEYKSKYATTDYGVKTISSYAEYDAAMKNGQDKFLVIGQEGCSHCQNFKPILEQMASIYKIKVFYINITAFTSEDRQALYATKLSIPAKCSKTGVDSDISQGFGTPLSLFVRGTETYDCIRGSKTKESLVSELKRIGYVD